MTAPKTAREKAKTTLKEVGDKIDNLNMWWKRLISIGAIIVGIATGCVAVSNTVAATLDEHIVSQMTEVNEQVSEIKSQVGSMSKTLDRTKLDTMRLQLMVLIQNQPDEHSTILEVANAYFVYYGGDWVMSDLFLEWAEKEGVRVPIEIYNRISTE